MFSTSSKEKTSIK